MTSWRPSLAGEQGPAYERLIAVLERDIASGILAPGARLPPQRRLADRIELSVGTVTRAYVEAERRGLVRGEVGRGTFVCDMLPGADDPAVGPIDLSLNTIPSSIAARRLADGLSALRPRHGAPDLLAYPPAAGYDEHRQAAATWIEQTTGYAPDWTRLVITGGAQQAIAFACGATYRPGDRILCEEATFYGIKSVADHNGYRLEPVTMDAEGLIPAELDRVARATGAKALYTMPTVQNPTGRTMRTERRKQIAEIARARDLRIIEDDLYAAFAPFPAPRLAELAPERTFHIGGVSKCVAPGLRTGFLACPDAGAFERVLRAMRATAYATQALGPALFASWLADRSIDTIVAAQRDEIEARYAAAREILGDRLDDAGTAAPHVWLPMGEAEAERVAGRALRAGVAVTPPDVPFTAGATITGLRLCIGAPPSRAALIAGLRLVAGAMTGEPRSAGSALV